MEPQETAGAEMPLPNTVALVAQPSATSTAVATTGYDNWIRKDNVWTSKKSAEPAGKAWAWSGRLKEPVVPPIDCPSFLSLRQMLGYRRAGRTRTEKKFIHRFLSPLGMKVDGHSNYWKRIGDAPVMWACHTDSVHRGGGMQQLAYDTTTGLLSLGSKDEISNCLGADDAAGIWIMTEMIKAGVEGLYVFHRDEETGAGGSLHFAKHGKDAYGHVNMCISLDRYGYGSVITHQCGRCCSDEFAAGLAAALNDQHKLFDFKPDSTGLFTDSANYTDDIPECTNLSVGYWDHHTAAEEVSVPHLLRLRNALCNIDVAALPIKRNPAEVTDDDWSGYGSMYGGKRGKAYYRSFNWGGDTWPDDDKSGMAVGDNYDVPVSSYRETMFDMVCEHPEEIADLLESCGFDARSLSIELQQRGVAV